MSVRRSFSSQVIRSTTNAVKGRPSQRQISTDSRFFRVSEDVREALIKGTPVVALESTIYTHGFPYPENVALSSHLESLVRIHGGVPATIGVLDGVAHVGMDADMLIRLVSKAGNNNTLKVSRRDLGYICGMGVRGQKLNGGTTISGTMVLAHLAGIKVFATGGLGGVHRGGENSMDVSADLTELGRTPVAVVSSGCKSFLDIARTLEFLETQGVGVSTFADGREGSVDFPGFFSRDSGVKSPQTIQDEFDAAAIIHTQFQLPLTSGLLFGNPVPSQYGLSKQEMDIVMAQAVQEAEQQGIGGAANSPFVLKRIKELTKGSTIGANEALIEANVIRGTKVAVELAKLERGDHEEVASRANQFQPLVSPRNQDLPTKPHTSDSQVQPLASAEAVDLLVVGSLACDTMCDYSPFNNANDGPSPALHTSNPATISQSSGGVGHNVATAAHLAGAKVALASAVADDIAGKALLDQLSRTGMSTSSIMRLKTTDGARTAQYIGVNDTNKDLVIAMGDFSIFARPEFGSTEIWSEMLARPRPSWVVVDGNWSETATASIIQSASSLKIPVAFEPVSVVKAARVFHAASKVLSASTILPNHILNLATPNRFELQAMHKAARDSLLFESDGWWQVIDGLALPSSGSSDQLAMMTSGELVDAGIPQQSIQLLPFVPNLITKLGPGGCLLTSVLRKDDDRLTSLDSAPFILSRNHSADSPIGGVYLRLFEPEERIEQKDIASVNGVGDTLLGVLMAGLVSAVRTGKQARLEDLIPIAQRAATLTLRSNHSVSPDVQSLQQLLSKIR